MGARFRSWWQQIKRHPVATIWIALFVPLVVLVILGGYTFNWGWTGFNQPSKTLWDWLQLLGVLAVPVVVGLGAVWFTTRQGKVADAENKDNQREAALQAYIDKISELLLHEDLSKLLLDEPLDEKLLNPQVVIIALARTTTVLRILDQGRRGSLVRFLSQAEILTKCIKDELVGIDLSGADLTKVNLDKTNLEKAILQGAILREASLQGANLSGANLTGANLEKANLKGVTGITIEKLEKQAHSLKGATMPDGSIHP
jgi:hypothetical protein